MRHIENAGTSLDTFLAEPEVWSLEFGRSVNEHYGFKADSEGLTHLERRAWTPREVCITLVTRAGDEARADALKAVGDKLIENGARIGLQTDMVQTWAAHLDRERFRLTREGDDTYLVVEPPEEAVAANEPLAAQQEHVNATLRIQNRYTKGIYDHEYVPPTAAEVAADLTSVRELLETPTTAFHLTPHTAAALVVRNAIWSAAQGTHEALGDESTFAVQVAAWLEDTAEAFDEIGEIDLAIDWAKQAVDFGFGHQSLKAADYWCKLLEEHRPTEVLEARVFVFRRWPSSTSAARLHKAAGKAWPDFRDEAVATLAASPSDAVLFALLTLKEPQFAWNLAHSLALDSDHTWNELVKVYEKVDPLTVLPIHQRLVENELIEAGAQHYRLAAQRLAKMRKLSAGTERSAVVHDLIADLREIHRRRPRLQQEFDRAGLP